MTIQQRRTHTLSDSSIWETEVSFIYCLSKLKQYNWATAACNSAVYHKDSYNNYKFLVPTCEIKASFIQDLQFCSNN